MAKKRFSAEQIVTLLRQIEVLMAPGKSAPEACRDAAFRLATDSGAELEVLHLCAAAWQSLPYSTELSPFCPRS